LLAALAVKRREAVVAPGLLEKIQFPPSSKTKKRIKERFDLGMNEWNDSDDSNDDFLPLKIYRRALVHASHVVTFYDQSAKERWKQVSSSVNSLAALWIAAYYAP